MKCSSTKHHNAHKAYSILLRFLRCAPHRAGSTAKKSFAAQSSLEFAVLAGMFMILFIIFFYVLSNHIVQFQQERDARAAQDLLLKVQSELNLALRVHDGYTRNFWLPYAIHGTNYTITLSFSPDYRASEVVIEYRDRVYVSPVFINLSSNSRIERGKNIITKRQENITVLPVT